MIQKSEPYFITLLPGQSVDLLNWDGTIVKTKTNTLKFSVLVNVEGYGFKKRTPKQGDE